MEQFREDNNEDSSIKKRSTNNSKTKKGTKPALKYRDYPIDIRYGEKDWNMVSALREPLANMLDTKAEYNYYWRDGFGYIEDNGPGLPMSAFILGASSKSNDATSIGQFGEGLKLTFITSLRNDRKLFISTVGYGAYLEKFYSEDDNSTLMRVYYNNDSREVGTLIKIECTEEEWNESINLFLQFKKDYQKVDNNLFLPGGFVSVLGLITEERDNMIFSYDITDKSIVNRDRNAAKSKGLKLAMIKTLNGLKTQRAVRIYFESLDENPESEEFKLSLEPKNKDLWNSTLIKLYGDNICYSTTVQNDLKAQTKGFYVIRNLTKAVIKTLKYLGIQSSKEVTSDIKGDVGFIEKREKKIKFTISEDYCSDWTFVDAGREFLANAIDVSGSSDIKRYLKDGYYHIEDSGIGLQKEHFVIGNSQKKDSDIGKYGEGLKIASLVMTRQNRDVEIATVGTTYTPIIELNEEFGVNLFSIDYKRNNRKKGTLIKFKATEEEVESIENLFLDFSNNYRLIQGEFTDIVVENNGGVIYVNGLQSADVNTIVSYNIKDKKIVNTRDRNGVNLNVLNTYITDILNNLKDEEVIEKLLTDWKIDIHRYEYQLILNPTYIDSFKSVCNRIFEKSCIQTQDMTSNSIAKTAGYTLLSNIPPYIKEILINCGVPLSEEVAIEYSEGILLENRVVTVISPEYAAHWNYNDAVRELVANAIDTKTEFDLRYVNGKAIVEDNGSGIKKGNLILGSSNKKDDNSKIGYFGEGLKMACLVLARENRDVTIESVGFTFTPKIEYDKDFEVDLLVIYFKENKKEVGTKAIFNSTEEEVNSAKKQFLAFEEKFEKLFDGVYSPGGTIFVNGVAMAYEPDSIYSYNIESIETKSLLGRDRKSLNHESKMDSISKIASKIKDDVFIKNFIRGVANYHFEAKIAYHLTLYGRQKTIWRKVAEEIYPNSCLPSSTPYANMVAEDKGIKVLSSINSSLSELLREMNFPAAERMVQLRGGEDVARNVIKEDDLTLDEKEKWDVIKSVFIKEYGEEYREKVLICESFTDDGGGKTLGMYSSKHDCCYILRDLLTDYTIPKILGIVAHEICHRESEEADMTRGFENALTDIIGELLASLYKVK